MLKPVRSTVALAATAVLALTMAACGGDDSGTKASATVAATSVAPTTVAPAPTTTTAADPAADKAAAGKLVLQQSDLPAGWVAKPSTQDTSSSSSDDGTTDQQVAACAHLDPALAADKYDDQTSVDSNDFDRGDTAELSNTVEFARSVDLAKAEVESFKKPEVPACLKKVFDDAVAKESGSAAGGPTTSAGAPTIEPVQVAPLPFAALGDDSTAFKVTFTVQQATQQVTVELNMVLAVKGRTEITVTGEGLGGPFPLDVLEAMARKVVDRAPAT
jgi:hypothetical protein